MALLIENPLPIILFGIIAEAILGVILLQTGRGVLLWAMGGVLVVVLCGVGLEWLVVTDVERVEAVLGRTVAALEDNDLEAVLACCSESADHTRREARRAIRLVEFTRVKITRLDIQIIRHTSPPMAKARFSAMVAGRDRKGNFGQVKKPIGFTLTLREEPDGWRVTEHVLENAPMGF